MPELVVTTRGGLEQTVHMEAGLTLMEAVRASGIDELLAICGGNCSCATCHVYVSAEDLSRLPPIGLDENELLDTSEHRTEFSRLSCQLRVEEALDGLSVTIAPED